MNYAIILLATMSCGIELCASAKRDRSNNATKKIEAGKPLNQIFPKPRTDNQALQDRIDALSPEQYKYLTEITSNRYHMTGDNSPVRLSEIRRAEQLCQPVQQPYTRPTGPVELVKGTIGAIAVIANIATLGIFSGN